jgi:hypothetical protein
MWQLANPQIRKFFDNPFGWEEQKEHKKKPPT